MDLRQVKVYLFLVDDLYFSRPCLAWRDLFPRQCELILSFEYGVGLFVRPKVKSCRFSAKTSDTSFKLLEFDFEARLHKLHVFGGVRIVSVVGGLVAPIKTDLRLAEIWRSTA